MSKISKEQKLYAVGMEYALKIAREGGIEFLETEVRMRQSQPIPLNVNHRELTYVARNHAKNELKIVATALADTIANEMHFPPSIIGDFLVKFNRKVDVFRVDEKALEAASKRLDRQAALTDTVRKFVEDELEDNTNE